MNLRAFIVPDKRLLYLTSHRLQAFSWKAGVLARDGAFETGEPGVAGFARYVAGSPASLYYLVADLVDEDFVQENLPYVHGRDRRALIARKLAQRYRDTSLALTLTLGTRQAARREERVLFSSFTNTQQFQPWLEALKSSEARLVGVYSLALIAPLLARRINVVAPRFVLMSHQESGLRQSYVEDGQIRFSRLGRAESADPRAAAEACAAESARIQQYLINLRVLPRESGPLDIVVLAPAEQRRFYEAACGSNPRLHFHLVDLEAACRSAGLKSAPEGLLCERLFLHVLAETQPRRQFAGDALRRHYHAWLARLALLSGGAAVCALCLLLSGLKLLDAASVRVELASDKVQEARGAQQYAGLQARFPKTPLSREDLKQTVQAFNAMLRQTVLPGPFLAEIGTALATVPQIDLDRLDWEITGNPRSRGATDVSKPEGRRGAPAAEAAKPAPSRLFEVAEISARITGVQGGDYRAMKAIVSQFVDSLRQRPGLEVIGTQMPFDFLADKSVAGDVSEEERGEAPKFSVTVSRRIGS